MRTEINVKTIIQNSMCVHVCPYVFLGNNVSCCTVCMYSLFEYLTPFSRLLCVKWWSSLRITNRGLAKTYSFSTNKSKSSQMNVSENYI